MCNAGMQLFYAGNPLGLSIAFCQTLKHKLMLQESLTITCYFWCTTLPPLSHTGFELSLISQFQICNQLVRSQYSKRDNINGRVTLQIAQAWRPERWAERLLCRLWNDLPLVWTDMMEVKKFNYTNSVWGTMRPWLTLSYDTSTRSVPNCWRRTFLGANGRRRKYRDYSSRRGLASLTWTPNSFCCLPNEHRTEVFILQLSLAFSLHYFSRGRCIH